MRTRGVSLFDQFLPAFSADLPSEAASVISAVDILLNTRSPFSLSVCENLPRRTVIDYGLPDFLHLSPISRAATHRLARAVRDTIVAHEPRLSVRGVEVEAPRPCRDAFRVLITGEIIASDKQVEKVNFSVDVR